jgi:hypothetical protein
VKSPSHVWGSTGWSWSNKPFALALLAGLACSAVGGVVKLREPPPPPPPTFQGSPDTVPIVDKSWKPPKTTSDWLFFAGGFFALMAIGLPFLADLPRFRARRVWAIARLSIKEALRSKVLLGFSALILVFLFAGWFVPSKPEDQVRSYVKIVYWTMTPLLLFSAGLLASFSIPTDIRSMNIHTIVTKPVERFEIVVGRFLGYVLLMTVVLIVMTAASLLYVFRGVDEDAKFESLRARVPIYGDRMEMFDAKGRTGGISVGREWEYRNYIVGGRNSRMRAIWSFDDLPRALATTAEGVPCEFSFDIFRSHKGEENRGVLCRLSFESWRWDPNDAAAVEAADRVKSDPVKASERFGVYAPSPLEIFDYHTMAMRVPAGVFQNQFASKEELASRADQLKQKGQLDPTEQEELRCLTRDVARLQSFEQEGRPRPPMTIVVRCSSPGQYLGIAHHDLYMLSGEKMFAINFFKGAAGLWFLLCLVIGISVACSTYLSGVISGMVTAFLLIAGIFGEGEFIQSLAEGKEQGGGPAEAMIRLANQSAIAAQLEETPIVKVAGFYDEVFRYVLKFFIKLLPNVNRYFLTDYLASGFDISEWQLFVDNFLPMAGYLLPWAILAYYLMKTREVATW